MAAKSNSFTTSPQVGADGGKRSFQKIDNHVAMVALYATWYNFAGINSAIRMSPRMAGGLERSLFDVGDSEADRGMGS
jgi:hypothetical protein